MSCPNKLKAWIRDYGGFVSDLTNTNLEHVGHLEKEIVLIVHPIIIQLNITYLKEIFALDYLLRFPSYGV